MTPSRPFTPRRPKRSSYNSVVSAQKGGRYLKEHGHMSYSDPGPSTRRSITSSSNHSFSRLEHLNSNEASSATKHEPTAVSVQVILFFRGRTISNRFDVRRRAAAVSAATAWSARSASDNAFDGGGEEGAAGQRRGKEG